MLTYLALMFFTAIAFGQSHYVVQYDQCREVRTVQDLAPIQFDGARTFKEVAQELQEVADIMELRLLGLESDLSADQKIGEYKKVLEAKREALEALRSTARILYDWATTAEELAWRNQSGLNPDYKSVDELRSFCDKDVVLINDASEAMKAYEEAMVQKFVDADQLKTPP